ncbi:DUF2309 domain-containing protein [Psychroflexus tropicus]|uniref:DUF2309 domain-containing protein n=1 Tax=Psychroflexus tropicus TaxID=197345 RepID=UPI000379977B|nr:DUF2309 domain-containing protein [Psychroflexus tropicus]
MDSKALQTQITEASKVVGTTWPLYAFVTSNPLSGYEASSFREACENAFTKMGNLAYPDASFFKSAIDKGYLTEADFKNLLLDHHVSEDLSAFFEELDHLKTKLQLNPTHKVDQLLVKWLSAFLDEGVAAWDMPNKQKGFYQAWKSLAIYDKDLNMPRGKSLPESSLEVITELTAELSQNEQKALFESYFAALPGWVGFIKYRIQQSPWQETYPLHLEDYIAVRLLISKGLGFPLSPSEVKPDHQLEMLKVLDKALSQIEQSWQSNLLSSLSLSDKPEVKKVRPDAQLVFCIDTRSELIRRNIEVKGNYQTYGYAGFFGIAMDYEVPFSGLIKKSCPPILDSAYRVTEAEKATASGKDELEKQYRQKKFKTYFLNRMKNLLPSAFGFVEGAGLVYLYQLLKRSFNLSKNEIDSQTPSSLETVCETDIKTAEGNESLPLEEQTLIVKSAFDLMGWKTFAPLVVFSGHGSHTTNNPFASSLDCGACAASPGRHNARMIARLANSEAVKTQLKEKHDLEIPEDTLFLAAEHNTTTEEITLFDADAPETFRAQIDQLKADLYSAQETATAERLGESQSLDKAILKATDWSETRPEWGLAKNAGFIIGSRDLTQHVDLDGECFLHSYNWEADPEGEALNAILNGPMVVTQWINNHYYFSTVDNLTYGGGSKITHNVVGKFGVVQGNGGDLKFGLPLQSVNMSDEENYHQPQRLSVFVHAPKARLDQLLTSNPHLQQLIENRWIHLLVIDPTAHNQVYRYQKDLNWQEVEAVTEMA